MYTPRITRCAMKKFKAAMPTVFYTVLLLSIALLSFLIIGRNESLTASNAVADRPSSEQTQSEGEPKETTPSTEKERGTVYSDVFPRKSLDGNQRIYGEGNVILNDVLQTAVGNYCILSCDCKTGDIYGDTPSVYLVKTNEENDLISRLRIFENDKFVAAQATANCIVIVSVDTNNTVFTVYLISYDLSENIRKYKLNAAKKIRIVATEESFLLFTSHKDESFVYFLHNDKLLFQSLDLSSLVELFEYEDHYLLFGNHPDGGFCSFTLYKDTLSVGKKKTIGSNVLLYVAPTFQDGQGYFVTLEEVNNKTFARKYLSSTMEKVGERELGSLNVSDFFSTNEGMIVLCDGTVTGYIALDYDLSASFYEKLPDDGKIVSVLYENDVFFYLIRDENGDIVASNGQNLGKASNGKLLLSPSGKLQLYIERTSDDDESYIELTEIMLAGTK